jgi:CheY-like chemotaxis protein
MDFVNQYLLEIISSIAIITLLLILLLIKTSTKLKEHNHTDEQNKAKPKEVNLETSSDSKQSPEVEISTTEDIAHTEKDVEEVHTATTNRIKREPIAHDKITKDDFSDFKGVRILVAEDNAINQKVITALLANSGIEVTMANDGQECLNILNNDTDFSLILMDAHMPILDGFQTTRHIRKEPKYEHIPIIALSGDTAADDIKNMLNVGMEKHLQKPLKLDELYDILYMYTSDEEKEIKTDSNSNNEKNKILSMEFNVEKGLATCGGDKEFFLEILNDFMSKYSASAESLRNDLNSNNSIHADKELLDISGVAANIGADHLHSAALALKNSIAHPDDMEYINLLKEFKRSLITATYLIEEYRKNN